MQDLNDNIPELKIEFMADGMGDGLILLEQDSGGNVDRVAIHPIHLRYLAEKMGLVETSDRQAQKTIATLTRRLLLLRDRIEHLDDLLMSVPCFPPGSGKDSMEDLYSSASLDLVNEFCAELDDVEPQEIAPALIPTAKPSAKAPAPATSHQLDLLNMRDQP